MYGKSSSTIRFDLGTHTVSTQFQPNILISMAIMQGGGGGGGGDILLLFCLSAKHYECNNVEYQLHMRFFMKFLHSAIHNKNKCIGMSAKLAVHVYGSKFRKHVAA